MQEHVFIAIAGNIGAGKSTLTGLLLPQLLIKPNGRVITISSMVHHQGSIDFENLDGDKPFPTPSGKI